MRVPADADIVIEGYIDPSEEMILEGRLEIILVIIHWQIIILSFILPVLHKKMLSILQQ